MKQFKYAGIFVLFSLTACTIPTKPINQALPTHIQTPLIEHKAKISALTHWRISGAMAAKNKRKGFAASLDWQQNGLNQYQIRLFGPLGNGAVFVEKSKGIITYTDGPKKLTSTNADNLLQKEMGVPLPVNNLYYWVRGLPAPGAVQWSTHDEHNRLTTLKQDGYTIDYLSYKSTNGYDLPNKIRLQGNNILIKLVIKKWKI